MRRHINPSILFRIEVIFAIAFCLAVARQASAECVPPSGNTTLSNFSAEISVFQQCMAQTGQGGGIFLPPPYPNYPQAYLPPVPVQQFGGQFGGGGSSCERDVTIALQYQLIQQSEVPEVLQRCLQRQGSAGAFAGNPYGSGGGYGGQNAYSFGPTYTPAEQQQLFGGE